MNKRKIAISVGILAILVVTVFVLELFTYSIARRRVQTQPLCVERVRLQRLRDNYNQSVAESQT